MGFTDQEFMIGQDLFAREQLLDGERFHMLGMYSIHFYDFDPVFQVEAYKLPSAAPYYAFRWLTSIEEGRTAAEIIDDVGELEGFDAQSGKFVVFDFEDHEEFDWRPEETGEAQLESISLDFNNIGLVRLETERGAIVWHKPDALSSGYGVGVITDDDIRSPWIRELVAKTADEPIRDMIADNIGSLAAKIAEFSSLPQGTPLPENLHA
jgi:hypothetical protein